MRKKPHWKSLCSHNISLLGIMGAKRIKRGFLGGEGGGMGFQGDGESKQSSTSGNNFGGGGSLKSLVLH